MPPWLGRDGHYLPTNVNVGDEDGVDADQDDRLQDALQEHRYVVHAQCMEQDFCKWKFQQQLHCQFRHSLHVCRTTTCFFAFIASKSATNAWMMAPVKFVTKRQASIFQRRFPGVLPLPLPLQLQLQLQNYVRSSSSSIMFGQTSPDSSTGTGTGTNEQEIVDLQTSVSSQQQQKSSPSQEQDHLEHQGKVFDKMSDWFSHRDKEVTPVLVPVYTKMVEDILSQIIANNHNHDHDHDKKSTPTAFSMSLVGRASCGNSCSQQPTTPMSPWRLQESICPRP
jgi:hypothetical protein